MFDKLINLKQFTETSHAALEQQTYKIALFNNSLREQIIRQLPKDIAQEQDHNLYNLLSSLYSHNAYYTYVDSKDIENLSINDLDNESKLGYFYCLYQCNPLLVLDNENNTTLNSKVITQNFGYKDDFYLSFIVNKDSLNDTYLQARKALYKTMMNLRKEREQEYQKEQTRISQLSYEEYKEEQGKKERQERFSSRNTNTNNLILESKDKNNVIIFLDSANSLSNLIHIHNERIDIFTKDTNTIDIQELAKAYQDYGITLDSLHSSNTQIFLYSQLLLGSKESPNNPLFFGELNKEGVFIESKPVYHLIGEIDSNSIESTSNNIDSNNSLSTLQVFLGSNTLTLLNYSLIDSSLNIKLECNSKESKEILEKEQTQREQTQKESTPIDSLTSTAFLHPILEDNELKCPHNGVVKLKSNKGKPFKSKGIPMILESDLINSSIVGCTNNIAGVPTPCTLISVILPSARALKKYNDDYPIMQDLVNGNVFSDKGFPLIATPKPNTFKINSPKPTHTKDTSKEALASVIRLTKPSMRLRYKINTLQRDNLPIYRLKLNGEIIESSSDDEALKSITLDIHKDTKDLDSTIKLDKRAYSSQSTHNTTTHNNTNTTDNNATDSTTSLLSLLLKDYPKYYEFKEIDLQLDTNLLSLILIIPKKIPKVYDKAYKEYEYKDYGVGRFQYVYRYCECRELEVKNNDYTNIGLHGDALTQYIITLLTPAKAKKIEIHLANGVDSMTESKDDVDSHILKCSVINGGHSERLWGDI
ncbi:lipase [Helicobacter bilis]|uniref:lipase n=1 Tax=Helicobacter bilis TaxID=37372 RepID=UPI0020C4860B|nr:lipase [Helicobacter bilis]